MTVLAAGEVWKFAHDQLQKITKALKPDADAVARTRTYKIDKRVGDQVYYESFPFPEVNTGD